MRLVSVTVSDEIDINVLSSVVAKLAIDLIILISYSVKFSLSTGSLIALNEASESV